MTAENVNSTGVSGARVRVEQSEVGVTRLVLCRPEALNTIDEQFIDEFHSAIDHAQGDSGCRVIHLASTGPSFCAGFDMNAYDGNPDARGGPEVLWADMDRLAALPLRLRRADQIVVASVRGAAVGGGFGIALGADIVFAGESAYFQLPQVGIGLLAGEMGMSYLLPRVLGVSRAANLMLRGRKMDAQSALDVGLVAEVHSDSTVDEVAATAAVQLARRPAHALVGTKRLLMSGLEATSVESASQLESYAQVIANYNPGLREAVASFHAGRDA